MYYLKKSLNFPHITYLINHGGGLDIGYSREMNLTAFAFDEGGVVWEGKTGYESLEDLLVDAESGIKQWRDANGLFQSIV